jgi:hypothetical protein
LDQRPSRTATRWRRRGRRGLDTGPEEGIRRRNSIRRRGFTATSRSRSPHAASGRVARRVASLRGHCRGRPSAASAGRVAHGERKTEKPYPSMGRSGRPRGGGRGSVATDRARGAERRAGAGREERAGQRRGVIGGALRSPRRLVRCCDCEERVGELAREGNPRTGRGSPRLHWQLQKQAPQNDTTETAWIHDGAMIGLLMNRLVFGYHVGRKKAVEGSR